MLWNKVLTAYWNGTLHTRMLDATNGGSRYTMCSSPWFATASATGQIGLRMQVITQALGYHRTSRWDQRLSDVLRSPSHEPHPGSFVFTGNQDIVSFLTTAQEVGLDVILRSGPFMDAERDFGGLPAWLLKNKDIKLRTKDRYYMERVGLWFTKLFSVLRPLLFKNGGPIIMIQIENEYGSFALQTGHKDIQYLTELRDLVRRLVGSQLVHFCC